MSHLRNLTDIDDPHIRISRRFEKYKARLGRHGAGERVSFCEINKMHLDTKARKPMLHKGECAAVQRLVSNDLVTRLKKRPQ